MKWICDHSSWISIQAIAKYHEKKFFRGFNGIRTRGLCVRAAVLSQLSYEDPHTGSGPIYWVHQPAKRKKHRVKLCEYKRNEYVAIAADFNIEANATILSDIS